MKKLILLFAILGLIVSCEPDNLNENNETATELTDFIEPEEECPEWDRCNCNEIPDSEESPNPCG